MTKPPRVADIVSVPHQRILSLRARDARLDEACADFAELSELLQRLSDAADRDAGAIDVVRESLDEVTREIRKRLRAGSP